MEFDKLYPKEKQRQVEEHLRKVWAGEIPCTYSSLTSERYYRGMRPREEMYRAAAENILLNAQYPGYNPPRFIVDYETVSTAAYWGGKLRRPVGGCLSIEPVIRSAEEAELVFPGDPRSGDAAKGLEDFAQVRKLLGTEEIRCTTIDFQGPLNTAALLWEQMDFMTSMCTDPEAVHAFLDRVTDHLIQVIRSYIEDSGHRVCGNTWPYIWLPDDIGVCMTEDYMPLLSAEMYREFGIPYVERISREFGGVFLHCCGEYAHQLQVLKDSDIHLLGLEFHYPFVDPKVMFDIFGDSVLLVPFLSAKGQDGFPKFSDYLFYLHSIQTPETRLWLLLDPKDPDYPRQLEAARKITSTNPAYSDLQGESRCPGSGSQC